MQALEIFNSNHDDKQAVLEPCIFRYSLLEATGILLVLAKIAALMLYQFQHV